MNGLWVSIIEWLNEFFKGLEVLDVILRLVQSLSDSQLNASPLGSGQVNLVSWVSSLISWVLRGLSKNIVDCSTVLAPELL